MEAILGLFESMFHDSGVPHNIGEDHKRDLPACRVIRNHEVNLHHTEPDSEGPLSNYLRFTD